MPQLVRFDRIESDAYQQVGLCKKVDYHAVAGDAAADAEEQRVVFGKDSLGLRRDEYGHAGRFDETPQRSGVGVRVKVEAENQDRPRRPRKFVGHTVDRGIGRVGRRIREQLDRCRVFRLPIRPPRDVARQRQVDRAESRLERPSPRPPHRGCRVHAVERQRLLGKRTEHRVQIELLVRGERLRGGGRGCGDGEERRSIEERVGHTKCEIERARTERRDAHRRPAGHLSGGIGHERGHGFVAGQDELDAGFAGGFDEIENLAAGQTEHPFDAGLGERCGEHFSAGRHDQLPRL